MIQLGSLINDVTQGGGGGKPFLTPGGERVSVKPNYATPLGKHALKPKPIFESVLFEFYRFKFFQFSSSVKTSFRGTSGSIS